MKKFRVLLMIPAFALALAFAGCASVDPAPFNQFSTDVGNLRQGVEAQMASDVQNTRARFVQKVESGEIPPFKLQLRPANPGSFPPFGMQYGFENQDAEPLYFKMVRFQQALGSLNDAIAGYASVLAKLAGDEMVDRNRFDQMANDLNANASSAAQTLGLGSGGEELALITTVAMKIFQTAIEKKRQRELGEAIREVQPQVEMYSRAVQSAIKSRGNGVAVNYDDKIGPLINRPPPASAETLEAILLLNGQTQQTMNALGALYTSYGLLPGAHASLVQAASKKPGALTGLLEFTNETLRLHALYEVRAAQNQ
jgi:hypothetical protein